MPVHRIEALLGLARQGLEIGVEFGSHSLEAMAWIALTIESSVYLKDSLVRTPTGLRFTLANPPLRTGAFSACRIGIDGRPPTAENVRWRSGSIGSWNSATRLSAHDPMPLRAGEPTEFEVDLPLEGDPRPRHVRLELECRAIPPLVWFEFTDSPRAEGPAP